MTTQDTPSPSESMVERVARALFFSSSQGGRWENVAERGSRELIDWESRAYWRSLARAVIEALREPTSGMLDSVAGWPEHWPREELEAKKGARWAAYKTDRWSHASDWQIMIDAALSEQP